MLTILAIPAACVVILGAVALAAIASKRRANAANLGALVLVAIGIAAVLFFYSTARVDTARQQVARAAAQQVAAANQIVAQQRAAIARQTAQIEMQVHNQIANMNIHALMDKADEPRIALPPDPPAVPESPEVEAAQDEASDAAAPTSDADEASDPAAESDDAPESDPAPESHESAEKAESGEAETSADQASDTVPDDEAEDKAATDEETDAAAHSTEEAHQKAGAELVDLVNHPETDPRPAWVDAASKRVGNTWRNVIVTDEFATTEECYREADRLLARATIDHLQVISGNSDSIIDDALRSPSDEGRQEAARLASMGITIDYIRREVAKDEHLETVERSFGPMRKLYTLVEFTPAVDRELRAHWDVYRRQERFSMVGLGAASVLGLIGLAWGLLRVDTLTRGYYTKRLFLGVPATIIGASLFFLVLSKLFAKLVM